MKILTKEILNKLPKIGETAQLEAKDVKVHLKIFNPYGTGRWYITEYNENEDLAFGYVNIMGPDFAELGYIQMSELVNFKNSMGFKLERDIYFEATLEDIIKSGGTI